MPQQCYLGARARRASVLDMSHEVVAERSMLIEWAREKRIQRVQLNGCGATVMLESVDAGEEEPIYSARSLRTRCRA